jgi:hypothetical protein
VKDYEQGYQDGESSQLADWQAALDDMLPEDVDVQPRQVAAYISRLQENPDGLNLYGDPDLNALHGGPKNPDSPVCAKCATYQHDVSYHEPTEPPTVREVFKERAGHATILWWHFDLLCEVLGIDPDTPIPENTACRNQGMALPERPCGFCHEGPCSTPENTAGLADRYPSVTDEP